MGFFCLYGYSHHIRAQIFEANFAAAVLLTYHLRKFCFKKKYISTPFPLLPYIIFHKVISCKDKCKAVTVWFDWRMELYWWLCWNYLRIIGWLAVILSLQPMAKIPQQSWWEVGLPLHKQWRVIFTVWGCLSLTLLHFLCAQFWEIPHRCTSV